MLSKRMKISNSQTFSARMNTASLSRCGATPWHRPSTTIRLLLCSILCPSKCGHAYHYRFVRLFFLQFFGSSFVSSLPLFVVLSLSETFSNTLCVRARALAQIIGMLDRKHNIDFDNVNRGASRCLRQRKWTACYLTKRIRHEFYVDKVIATHITFQLQTVD